MPSRDAEAGDCDDRRDDIATPVHNVEDGAFDRGRLLTLHSLAELWGRAEVLRSRRERREQIADENQSQGELEGDCEPS